MPDNKNLRPDPAGRPGHFLDAVTGDVVSVGVDAEPTETELQSQDDRSRIARLEADVAELKAALTSVKIPTSPPKPEKPDANQPSA